MKINSRLLLLALSTSVLSAFSSLDAINPFDETESDRLETQGDVAGDDQRISILELSETLTVTAPTSPDLIVLPDPYVNTDWPQAGGNVQHAVQHTGATGPLDRAWSKDVGEGSGRKGRVIAPPVVAGGMVFTLDARYNVTATDEASGNELWKALERPALLIGLKTHLLSQMATVRIKRASAAGSHFLAEIYMSPPGLEK